jgi:hypothetical protein
MLFCKKCVKKVIVMSYFLPFNEIEIKQSGNELELRAQNEEVMKKYYVVIVMLICQLMILSKSFVFWNSYLEILRVLSSGNYLVVFKFFVE